MEELLTAIFGRMLIFPLGRFVLLRWYRITNNKNGVDWLTKPENEMADMTGGCLVGIVGLGALAAILFGLGYIYYELLALG